MSDTLGKVFQATMTLRWYQKPCQDVVAQIGEVEWRDVVTVTDETSVKNG